KRQYLITRNHGCKSSSCAPQHEQHPRIASRRAANKKLTHGESAIVGTCQKIGRRFVLESGSPQWIYRSQEKNQAARFVPRSKEDVNSALAEEGLLHLRVGIHLGDVVESDGDISGDAVNVASRIESLADDGGVCITRQVYDQVQNKFELPLESLETKPLSGVG